MKQGTEAFARHEQLVEVARKYKAEGHSHREVAERFGKSEQWSVTWCKGIMPMPGIIKNPRNQYTSGNFDRIENARQIIEKNYPTLEYVRGFTHIDKPVIVRCKICGAEFERSMITLRHKIPIRCEACYRVKQENIQKERQQEKTRKKYKRESQSFNARQKQLIMRFCACGELLNDPNRTMCKACARNKQKRRDSEKKYKRRIQAFTKETCTISLRKLFDKDEGICWICGNACDYKANPNDNVYPSIDHILPISKGGRDEWSNIRLAHRGCNSKRGNRVHIPPMQKTELADPITDAPTRF